MKTMHVTEGQKLWLLARPTGPQGTPIVAANVSAATLTVHEVVSNTPGTAVWTKTLNPALAPPLGCMAATVLTDDQWTRDEGGYTFWQPLEPGDLDNSTVALDLKGGMDYMVLVSLVCDLASGSTYPELDDMGTVVLTWRVKVGDRP